MTTELPKTGFNFTAILKCYVKMIRYISNDVVWQKFMIFVSKTFYDGAGKIANFIINVWTYLSSICKTDTMNGANRGTYPAFNDFPSVHHTYEQQEVMKNAYFRNAKTPIRSCVVRNRDYRYPCLHIYSTYCIVTLKFQFN